MLHELRAKGKSIRAIARETGRSRNTVRKYLRAEGISERKPHPKRGSKLDPYKDIIQELINLGIFNCEVIYERIKEEGYTGGRTILRSKESPQRRAFELRWCKIRRSLAV